MRSINSLSFIFLFLAVALQIPESLLAQGSAQPRLADALSVRGNRSQVEPGISLGTFSFRQSGNRFEARELQLTPDMMFSEPELLLATPQFWSSEELRKLGNITGQSILVNILPEDEFLAVPTDDHGFIFADERVWSWPPKGDVAVITSQGDFSVAAIEDFESSEVILPDDTSVPLSGVNVRPEQDGIFLLSGRFLQRPSLQSWFAHDTLAIPFASGIEGMNLHQSFWTHRISDRISDFQVSKKTKFSNLVLNEEDYALVINSEEYKELFNNFSNNDRIQIRINLPDEILIARAAFEIGPRVFENGEMLESLFDFQTFFIHDKESSKYMFLDVELPGGISKENFKLSMREHFSKKKNSTVWQFNKPNVDVVNLDEADASEVEVIRKRSHGVLYFKEQNDSPLKTDSEEVALLEIISYKSSTPYSAGTTAQSAFDGSINIDDELQSVWVEPIKQSTSAVSNSRTDVVQAWIEGRLKEKSVISHMDLVHAEGAGFHSQFNIKSYRVLGRESNSTRWREMISVDHESPRRIERHQFEEQQPVEYVRLEIIKANFQENPKTVRLAEWSLWGKPVID